MWHLAVQEAVNGTPSHGVNVLPPGNVLPRTPDVNTAGENLGYDWWNECRHGVGRAGTATAFPQSIGLAAIEVAWSRPGR
jgi:hypothetical protein